MFDNFETYLKKQIKLSDEDIELICSRSVEKTIRRNEILLREGQVCRYKIFVRQGLLRAYRTRADGSEHIMQFAPENSCITDVESYVNLTPADYNIDALEDSQVILWTKSDSDYLVSHIPGLKGIGENIVFKNLILSRKRIFSVISSTSEEKYDEFIRNFPGVFTRVPLHMVASYLGISRKTLTRIRNAQVKRQ